MSLSYCLIGEDSLLIQCGKILLSRKHTISVVVSPIKSIRDWAARNNILTLQDVNDLKIDYEPNAFDYIFSIVNSKILSKDIIDLAKKYVINYHDSPLPRYAGLNSTTWALINQEKKHGVSWHVVNEKIDEGDIIKQKIFNLNERTTAIGLNIVCYESAIETFRELIDDIETNMVTFKKQLLNERTFYSSQHLLPNLGFIDWRKNCSDEIVKYSRALSFGHYNNHVGTLKIWLNQSYWVVSEIEKIAFNKNNNEPPGTILAINVESISISTKDGAIVIREIRDSYGQSLMVDTLRLENKIHVGYKLPDIEIAQLKPLEFYYKQALKYEKSWVETFKNISEHSVFFSTDILEKHKLIELPAKVTVMHPRKTQFSTENSNLILSAILIYLYRLNNFEPITVYLAINDTDNYGYNLFPNLVPFNFNIDAQIKLCQAKEFVSKLVESTAQKGIYLSDIIARHISLEKINLNRDIIVNLTGNALDKSTYQNALLYFALSSDKETLSISHRQCESKRAWALQDIFSNIVQHIENIQNTLINQSHLPLANFSFLTPKEQHRIVSSWGQGKSRPISSLSICSIIAKYVEMTPDNIAIFMRDEEISYKQLWEQATRIAFVIHSYQLSENSYIGIYLKRSPEMLAVVLGILLAGCVYVPIDVKYPFVKIDYISNESNIKFIFSRNAMSQKLQNHFDTCKRQVNVICLEDIFKDEASFTDSNWNPQDGVEKTAYVMFTSGTTGAPKGVIVTQRNVLNYCKWFSDTTSLNSQSIVDFSSSIAFDLSVPCIIAPLLVGGSIAICEEVSKTNPELYLQHLKDKRVTHTELTPGYVEMLLNYPDEVKGLKDLKYLLLGADVVPTSDVMKWLALCPHHQVVNEYGPTETTVSATSYFVKQNDIFPEASIPIGRPAFNTSCYILDKFKNLCPSGVRGELYIGGEQVTLGYLNKPELTQERFLVTSLYNIKDIIYKTGDIACWLPSGNLQFYGRNDGQVKIQGYRVELTAIESILIKFPSIHQAVVVLHEDKMNHKLLRAYLVSENANMSANDLRSFLLTTLPSYMVPKEFFIVDAIPLKENEKIDFHALETQLKRSLCFSVEHNHNLSIPHIDVVKKIWEHAFNQPIETTDNFFEIGGDSLIALQIVSDLKSTLKHDIPLYFLFEYPTIEMLSTKLVELFNSETFSNRKRESKSIIKLADGKHKRPLFLIHPVGGSVFWYKTLASYLDGTHTIYGIQDVSIDGVDLKFNTLEEMAEHYLSEIDKVYSGAEYSLGGASFGATVAFEMARQLLDQNKKVSFLGLFDGWAEYPKQIMNEDSFKLLNNHEDTESNEMLNERLMELERYRKLLIVKYKIPPINAKVTLFKAKELWPLFAEVDDHVNGWSAHVKGKIDTYKIPGNHETMFFDPHVENLAGKLKKLL